MPFLYPSGSPQTAEVYLEGLIIFLLYFIKVWGFPGGSEVKESAWNAEDPVSIHGLGRSPGEGNGNPLQYSCLENPLDGGVWWGPWGLKGSDMTERLHFFHFQ